MESTGIFRDGREVTSIVLVDTESTNDHFRKYESDFINHIESLADHVVEFEGSSKTRTYMPVIELKHAA